MLNPKQRAFLDDIVARVPPRLDAIFLPLFEEDVRMGRLGACTSYSRIMAEVLQEFHWRTASVRPVYIETANEVSKEYLAGKISYEEAVSRGGKIQIWGDIRVGQDYQHAVCYMPPWDIIIDLAMMPRRSCLVPSHPYWAENGKLPSWITKFEFRTYRLEYRAYETQPDAVKEAKSFIRKVIREGYKE
jgi:hypothetical protein